MNHYMLISVKCSVIKTILVLIIVENYYQIQDFK